MNASRFDSIVKARANQRAQQKIEAFRASVNAAVKALGIKTPTGYYNGWQPSSIKEDLKNVLDNVAAGMYCNPGEASSANPLTACTWPAAIWRSEEEAVQKELLATMDEMQKALIAPAPTQEGPQPSTQ